MDPMSMISDESSIGTSSLCIPPATTNLSPLTMPHAWPYLSWCMSSASVQVHVEMACTYTVQRSSCVLFNHLTLRKSVIFHIHPLLTWKYVYLTPKIESPPELSNEQHFEMLSIFTGTTFETPVHDQVRRVHHCHAHLGQPYRSGIS